MSLRNGKITKSLNKRNMEGYYCDTKEDALAKALEIIKEGSSVGWGGSMTINEIGLMDAIKKGSYDVIDREAISNDEE